MKMLATEPSQRPSMAEVERVLRDGITEPRPKRFVAFVAVTASALALGSFAVVSFGRHRSIAPTVTSVAAETASASPTASAEPSFTTVAVAPAPPASSVRHTQTRAPQPRASAPTARVFELDVALGKVVGMGNAPTQSDVVAALRAMKPCLPAPTTDERWEIALVATWPKGGARTESFAAERNGAPLANAQIESCAQKTFDAATIATPDGQDDVGGTSYIRMSVGYY
jgi:hypothetical protein